MTSKLPTKSIDTSVNDLHTQISGVIIQARQNVQRVIDQEMVKAYWRIGQLIVLEEQKGESRAKYGDYLIKELSKRLTETHGKGFSLANIKNMRQFYIEYSPSHNDSIRYTLCSELFMK